jgi:hypothetical protein
MDETYTLGLSLLDFVPNLAFLAGSFFLVSLVRLKNDRACTLTTTIGTTLVFLGGMLKAIWKFLVTIGVGDFQLLSESQFVLLAPGFLLLLVGVVLLARHEKADLSPGFMAMAVWKIPLLAMTTIGSLGAYGILSYLAFRRQARVAGLCFILAIGGLLALAGMASAEQTIRQQWIEESINSLGQTVFTVGCYLLLRRVKSSS